MIGRLVELEVVVGGHAYEKVQGRFPLQPGVEHGVLFPQQFRLSLAGEAKGPDADQQLQLATLHVHAGTEVGQVTEGAVLAALHQQAVDQLFRNALHVDETEVDGLALQVRQVKAVVDARGVDLRAVHPRFVDVELRLVKAPEVVDHPHDEFQRVVGFQVQALEALHGEAGRMRLAERITREAFHLPPDLGGGLVGVPPLPGADEKLLPQGLEGVAVVFLPGHDAAQHVALVQVQAGEVVHDLHHVLLVHHDPEGLPEVLLEDGVDVFEGVRLVVTADVLLHHARFGHPGPDDAGGRHEVDVVVAPQFGKQPPHGGRLDVEAAQRPAALQHGPHVRVGLDLVQRLQVHRLAVVAVYEVGGRAQVAQAALAQHVVLVQAHILGVVHIAVGHREALGHEPLGGVVINGLFRHQDAAGVDAEVVGQAHQPAGDVDYRARLRVLGGAAVGVAYQYVDLLLGQAVHLGHLAQGRPALEGGVGSQQGGVLAAVALEDVVGDVVALVPAEVDVEVGRAGAVGVDEAFEVKVQFQGVHVRDADVVGDDGVGARSAPHVLVAGRAGVAHDVVGDEKVRAEFLLTDHGQFPLGTQPRPLEPGPGRVTAGHAGEGQFFQQLVITGLGAGEGLAVDVQPGVQFGGAGVQDALGVAQDGGVGAVELPQGVRGQQAVAPLGQVAGRKLGVDGVAVDGPQGAVQVVVLFRDGHHRGQDDELVLVVAQFVAEQAVDVLRPDAEQLVVAEVADRLTEARVHDPDVLHARGHGGQRPVVEGVVAEEAAEVVPALGVAGQAGIEPLPAVGILAAEADAQDGLDPVRAAGRHELHRAAGIVVVGQRQALHAPRRRLFHQPAGRQHAVAQAERGMAVEVHGGVGR